MATTATDSERQKDEFGYDIPTPEEMAQDAADREAERLKTEKTLNIAMTGIEGQLANRLPTQAAPVAPPPQPGPGDGAAYQFGRGIGVLAAPPTPTNQGRMYMGPAMTPGQEQQFMQSAPGTRMNLMPPPTPQQAEGAGARVAFATGGESDQARLARLQAADQPGSTTIGTRTEPPYSDASVANQQNMMRYNAMKAFDAGDRSPEIQALILGRSAQRPMSEFQQVSSSQRQQQLDQQKARSDKAITEKPDPMKALEAKSLFAQKGMLMGQIASPNTNPKKVSGLQSELDKVNSRLKELLPSNAGTASPAAAAPETPIQSPTPQGRTVKDKSGKTWIYTGTAKDPKTDKDPSHWASQ